MLCRAEHPARTNVPHIAAAGKSINQQAFRCRAPFEGGTGSGYRNDIARTSASLASSTRSSTRSNTSGPM